MTQLVITVHKKSIPHQVNILQETDVQEIFTQERVTQTFWWLGFWWTDGIKFYGSQLLLCHPNILTTMVSVEPTVSNFPNLGCFSLRNISLLLKSNIDKHNYPPRKKYLLQHPFLAAWVTGNVYVNSCFNDMIALIAITVVQHQYFEFNFTILNTIPQYFYLTILYWT